LQHFFFLVWLHCVALLNGLDWNWKKKSKFLCIYRVFRCVKIE
jgi:hypothetical protein